MRIISMLRGEAVELLGRRLTRTRHIGGEACQTKLVSISQRNRMIQGVRNVEAF